MVTESHLAITRRVLADALSAKLVENRLGMYISPRGFHDSSFRMHLLRWRQQFPVDANSQEQSPSGCLSHAIPRAHHDIALGAEVVTPPKTISYEGRNTFLSGELLPT
jgi:hypothetical protein